MSERTHLFLRIVLGLALFVSLFLSHFWVTLSLAFLGLVLIPSYWEFIAVAISVEILYRGGEAFYPFFLTYLPLVAVAVFLIVELLRSYVREQVLRT